MLYTHYVYLFQAAGLVLLMAMIGAIVLTLHHRRTSSARTSPRRSRAPAPPAIEIKNVPSRPGVVRSGQWSSALPITSSSRPSCSRSGVAGIILNRKNVIIILMSIELILLAVNINLVAFSAYLHDLTGQIFALFVLTVAAAEAAIGLAILVTYFRNRGTIAVEDINMMKG